MPSKSKTRQLDIFGNEVEYQNQIEPAKFYVYFVRSVRDWRSITNPDTGTVYRFLSEVPQVKLASLVGWGRHDDTFPTEEAARTAARQLVLDGKTFSAGVWKTYSRSKSDPVAVYSTTSRAEATKTHEEFLASEQPNTKESASKSKRRREQF